MSSHIYFMFLFWLSSEGYCSRDSADMVERMGRVSIRLYSGLSLDTAVPVYLYVPFMHRKLYIPGVATL